MAHERSPVAADRWAFVKVQTNLSAIFKPSYHIDQSTATDQPRPINRDQSTATDAARSPSICIDLCGI
ncbi:MAG: hypothetical protein EA001_12305 [Oscillatoriales cyanobacterium]|nr:MAG: hypothetical protein EA001_12305 [Oscillatoriales cyanobacterium]